ncbi:unnamed protein product [Caenorhabditis bovis]|nr:unnamed protein product [Caenorhabditis bovis]
MLATYLIESKPVSTMFCECLIDPNRLDYGLIVPYTMETESEIGLALVRFPADHFDKWKTLLDYVTVDSVNENPAKLPNLMYKPVANKSMNFVAKQITRLDAISGNSEYLQKELALIYDEFRAVHSKCNYAIEFLKSSTKIDEEIRTKWIEKFEEL